VEECWSRKTGTADDEKSKIIPVDGNKNSGVFPFVVNSGILELPLRLKGHTINYPCINN